MTRDESLQALGWERLDDFLAIPTEDSDLDLFVDEYTTGALSDLPGRAIISVEAFWKEVEAGFESYEPDEDDGYTGDGWLAPADYLTPEKIHELYEEYVEQAAAWAPCRLAELLNETMNSPAATTPDGAWRILGHGFAIEWHGKQSPWASIDGWSFPSARYVEESQAWLKEHRGVTSLLTATDEDRAALDVAWRQFLTKDPYRYIRADRLDGWDYWYFHELTWGAARPAQDEKEAQS